MAISVVMWFLGWIQYMLYLKYYAIIAAFLLLHRCFIEENDVKNKQNNKKIIKTKYLF